MSFFEVPPPDEEDAWDEPAWAAPPADEVGRLVVVDRVLAENDRALVLLRGAVVYSTGFELLLAERRPPSEDGVHNPPLWDRRADDFLRVGVQFPDGRRATNLDEVDYEEDPDGVVLLTRSQTGFWVYPLPPTGPVTVVVEWPAFGIPETRFDLEIV